MDNKPIRNYDIADLRDAGIPEEMLLNFSNTGLLDSTRRYFVDNNRIIHLVPNSEKTEHDKEYYKLNYSGLA